MRKRGGGATHSHCLRSDIRLKNYVQIKKVFQFVHLLKSSFGRKTFVLFLCSSIGALKNYSYEWRVRYFQ